MLLAQDHASSATAAAAARRNVYDQLLQLYTSPAGCIATHCSPVCLASHNRTTSESLGKHGCTSQKTTGGMRRQCRVDAPLALTLSLRGGSANQGCANRTVDFIFCRGCGSLKSEQCRRDGRCDKVYYRQCSRRDGCVICNNNNINGYSVWSLGSEALHSRSTTVFLQYLRLVWIVRRHGLRLDPFHCHSLGCGDTKPSIHRFLLFNALNLFSNACDTYYWHPTETNAAQARPT